MFIQHISVQKLGSIQFYEAEFTSELNLIDSEYTAEMTAVLSFLLCSHASQGISEQWMGEDTHILARTGMGDKTYTLVAVPEQGRLRLTVADSTGKDVTEYYRYILSHCPEQDAVEIFDGKDATIPLRLCGYRHREEEDHLSLKTQRFADTKTFRRHLLQYIKKFCPEPIHSKKKYQITMEPKGKFAVFYPGIPEEVYLSETEEKLFRYICFLNIVEFWTEFEKIRDLHYEKKPLLIQNFLEYLDESADIDGLLLRTLKSNRQVIILTPPMHKEI